MNIPDIKNDQILVDVIDELKFRLKTRDDQAHLTHAFNILLNEFIQNHQLNFDQNCFATNPQSFVNKLVQKVSHLESPQLLAGMALMSVDIHSTGHVDPSGMHNLIVDTLTKEKQHWADSPLWSTSLTQGVYSTDHIQDTLLDPGIVHEWATGTGYELFKKFQLKFKEVICGKDGPYEKFCNGLIGQADLPATIVTSILAAGMSVSTFWIPLLVYFALLLVKTTLKVYCEI